MKTAVVTAVRGRAAHLHNQLRGLACGSEQVDRHVVVAIDDDSVAASVPSDDFRTQVVTFRPTTARLPIAAARNLGAKTAIEDGAELLIFLDVDCIPAPAMVTAYRHAAEHSDHHDALLSGPVTYLPPPPPQGYDVAQLDTMRNPHPARPAPPDGTIVMSTDYELFWSLSFAVSTPVWQRIGGFCTDYTGYGGEDTDFAQQAAGQGVTMRWVGGAHAFHQFHPVSNPPVEHLHDIVANAVIFHRRWGWWPMQGWLNDFRAQGLIVRGKDGRPVIV
jgi:N-acetylglucosaminyl-diphospho-decaprenol L-rhamnosyltransferase